MGDDADSQFELRVLLVAPTHRDAQITADFLKAAGLQCVTCSTLHDVYAEIQRGCGVVLLTEEAISAPGIDALIRLLEAQPAWSDLPIVMLMRGGMQSLESSEVLRLLRNVTLLERPAPMRSVVSAVQAAMRARVRQYQARERIMEISRGRARYQELQQRLEIAIEASDLGTFHCEIPLGKVIWNDRCKAHFWLPSDAEVDMNRFYDLIHPDDREQTRQAVEDCVFRGKIYDIEYRTVSADGRIRWVRATGKTFMNANTARGHFDGTTRDITDLKRAAEERERLLSVAQAARVELEHAGRMKDEFLATLSHELRTPLNAILGWSQLISRADDRETVAEGLEVIERNARVQVQLIEDLLDMSRIISGKIRLDVQPVDPSTFINAALETVTPAARAKGIQLHGELDSPGAPIAADAGRLQQVVWNLLSNAIKFTDRGGIVRVSLERRHTHVEIKVSDTGRGISAEFLPHIFERFRQADASTTRSQGGLGLGLAIAKQLVELHGGSIHVASSGVGKGSVFTVTLPVLAEGRQTPPQKTRRTISEHLHPSDGAADRLAGLTVLVVDDEPDARSLVKRLLENHDANVVTAGSAAEGMEIIPTLMPDILVSDIGMPGIDGYEFLKRVRALGAQRGGDTPAIALTAFARPEDRTQALLAGYRLHITKPIEPNELIATIAMVCGRNMNGASPVNNGNGHSK